MAKRDYMIDFHTRNYGNDSDCVTAETKKEAIEMIQKRYHLDTIRIINIETSEDYLEGEEVMATIDELMEGKKPKLLWRRPYKYPTGEWYFKPIYYPSKEHAISNYTTSIYTANTAIQFGPWESIEEPEICED